MSALADNWSRVFTMGDAIIENPETEGPGSEAYNALCRETEWAADETVDALIALDPSNQEWLAEIERAGRHFQTFGVALDARSDLWRVITRVLPEDVDQASLIEYLDDLALAIGRKLVVRTYVEVVRI